MTCNELFGFFFMWNSELYVRIFLAKRHKIDDMAARTRCMVSSTPGHYWLRPRLYPYGQMADSWRSACRRPFSNTACGKTTARAVRRPGTTLVILAEPRNVSAADGSAASTTPQS